MGRNLDYSLFTGRGEVRLGGRIMRPGYSPCRTHPVRIRKMLGGGAFMKTNRWSAVLATALGAGMMVYATAGMAQVENETIGFLMPDQSSTRYEEHDHPGFLAEMQKLCESCKVIYLNADADATKQQQQFNSVIAQGAKVVVLDAVDTAAAASLVKQAQGQGVKVIAYDRPIPDAVADFYVSFDNEAIGKSIADSLIEHLKAENVSPEAGGLLQINGSPTDAAA